MPLVEVGAAEVQQHAVLAQQHRSDLAPMPLRDGYAEPRQPRHREARHRLAERLRRRPPARPEHDDRVVAVRTGQLGERRRGRLRLVVPVGDGHVPTLALLPRAQPGCPAPTARPWNAQQVVRFADDLVRYLDDERWQGALKHSGIIVPVRHAETVFDLTADEVAATFRMLARRQGVARPRARTRRLQRRLERRRGRRPAGLPRPPARDPPLRPGTPRRPGHPRPSQGRRQRLVSALRWLRKAPGLHETSRLTGSRDGPDGPPRPTGA